jgi:DNA-binding transcriptional ArsR family regulator
MDVFKALSVPTRRSIVELLAVEGELSATSISDRFKTTPQSISQHLSVLRDANLVEMRRRGQFRLYQLDPAGVNVCGEWAEKMTRFWTKRFDVLERVLQKEKRKRV